MKTRTKRIILTAAVAAVVVLVFALPKGSSNMRPDEQMETEATYTVSAQEIKKSNLQEYLSLNGNVQTVNSISVYPDISGKIVKVYVTLGSKVKRGDLIAEIDPSTPGSVYSVSGVYAPISGTITSLPLTDGTTVTTSSSIATIGSVRTLQVKTLVPEKYVGDLKSDLTADVSLVAYEGETFKAHVATVSPIVDETSRTKEVYLVFDEDDDRINAGMYAKLRLYTVNHENEIVIPYDAVSTIDGKSYVYVVDDDERASRREVVTGTVVDGSVLVLNGLSEGEVLITSGVQSLDDGVKVHVVEANQ